MKEKPWSRNTNNDGFWLPRLDRRALESAHPGMHQTKHRCNQRTPHNGSAPTEATPNKHPATIVQVPAAYQRTLALIVQLYTQKMETLVSRFMEGTSSKQAGLHHVINLFRQLHLFDSVQTYQSHDCTFPALNIADAKRRYQLVTSGIKEQPSVTKECSTTGTPTHGIFKAKTHSIEHFSF